MGLAAMPPRLPAAHPSTSRVARSVLHSEHRALQGAAYSSIHLYRPDALLQAIGDRVDR
jgi:hypothetical protein